MLLAIDPATNCGWAMLDDVGVWDLSTNADESNGVKWYRFRKLLHDVISDNNIKVVVYERPAGRHTGAVIHHAKLVAIIEELCIERGIDYAGYSATEIKKFATGKGNCSKADMIAAAEEQLDYKGGDDNEADALWLYMLASDDLGIY